MRWGTPAGLWLPHCLGLDRGPHLGQRTWRRVTKAGHMIAIDPPVRFLTFLLHPRARPEGDLVRAISRDDPLWARRVFMVSC